jgi:hypothetical protein
MHADRFHWGHSERTNHRDRSAPVLRGRAA